MGTLKLEINRMRKNKASMVCQETQHASGKWRAHRSFPLLLTRQSCFFGIDELICSIQCLISAAENLKFNVFFPVC